jgi:hypothetical protein
MGCEQGARARPEGARARPEGAVHKCLEGVDGRLVRCRAMQRRRRGMQRSAKEWCSPLSKVWLKT